MLYNIFLIICVLCSQVFSKRPSPDTSASSRTTYSRIVQAGRGPKGIVRRLQVARDKMMISVFKRDVESYTEYATSDMVDIFQHGKLRTFRPYSTILITDYERFFRMRAMSAEGFVVKKSNYHPNTFMALEGSSFTGLHRSTHNMDDIIYYFDNKK